MRKEVTVDVTVTLIETHTLDISDDEVDFNDKQQLRNYIEEQIISYAPYDMCQYAASENMYDDIEIEITDVFDYEE